MAKGGRNRLMKLGMSQAVGVTIYCATIGILFWKGNQIFSNTPNYFGPVAVLLLFSASALICGLLVFYRPFKMFVDGKGKEAADLVFFTALWVFAFFLIFLALAAILKF